MTVADKRRHSLMIASHPALAIGAALVFFMAAVTASTPPVKLAEKPTPATVHESLDIAPVWSGHPVGFVHLTKAPYQYVAYYDENRQLTVAYRQLKQHLWQRQNCL